MSKLSKVSRRLLPLYIAAFMQGMVFWYSIEKLFMTSIGFNNATIGLMIAVYSIVILIAETPSGILADRWSRKGVLIIAGILLAASAFIGGISNDVSVFIVSTMFWGAYSAFYSGTFESIIYDTLMEENGDSKKYKQFYGRLQIIEGASLVIGALLGGFIADIIGMREAFFLTIPFAVLSIILLLMFREPTLHKSEVSEPITKHIAQTFGAVLRRKTLIPLLVAIITMTIVFDGTLEFSQVWFIAVAMPLIFYGPAYALVLSCFSIGGFLAKYMEGMRIIVITLIVMVICTIGLIVMRDFISITILQVILCSGLAVLTIALEHNLHDHLPSKVRAGSSSAVSTLSRTIIIPFALLFGFVAEQQSIFSATFLFLIVIIIGSVATIIALGYSARTSSSATEA